MFASPGKEAACLPGGRRCRELVRLVEIETASACPLHELVRLVDIETASACPLHELVRLVDIETASACPLGAFGTLVEQRARCRCSGSRRVKEGGVRHDTTGSIVIEETKDSLLGSLESPCLR